MAAANALTAGSTTATSADVTVTVAGQIFCLKTVVGSVQVIITLKDDGGGYNYFDYLDGVQPKIALPIGVYQFSRVKGSCGVFSGG